MVVESLVALLLCNLLSLDPVVAFSHEVSEFDDVLVHEALLMDKVRTE